METRETAIAQVVVKGGVWLALLVTLQPRIAQDYLPGLLLTLILFGIAAEIANSRFLPSKGPTLAKCAAFVVLGAVDPAFSLLIISIAFDIAHKGPVPLTAAAIAGAIVFAPGEIWVPTALAALLAAGLGWFARSNYEKAQSHLRTIDNERALRYRSEQMRAKLDEKTRELIRATEHSERNRIAHSLHDDLGHRLTGVLMQLEAARTLAKSDPNRSAHSLETAISALRASMTAVREAVYDLRPRSAPLSDEIRRICLSFRPCPVRLHITDELSNLDEAVQSAILGVIRELLTNAARHAGAELIHLRIQIVSFEHDSNRLSLQYRDDGVGATTIRQGMGLTGLRRRVETLGGTVACRGNRGFSVDVEIPLQGAALG